MKLKSIRPACVAATLFVVTLGVAAQEATIRKNLGERVPELKQIDEISKTPMPGLFEVRVGNELLYTDAEGNYLISGTLLDTRAKKNLTDARVEKLTAIKFDDLDLKHALKIVRGNGKRQLAVFEDPNCGYCKRFEKDLQKVDNITVHLFLLPILSADSADKSQQIWCAADRGKAWVDWMTKDVLPKGNKGCNTEALNANLEFARKYRITGTPTLVFADGTRVPGAINTQQVEKLLAR